MEGQTIFKFEFPKISLTPFRKGGKQDKKDRGKITKKGENHET